MKNLILLCEKKVACVVGTVTRINKKTKTVTIQNTVYDTPISITLITKLEIIENLKLDVGAFVMAVVKPSDAIRTFYEGGECNETEMLVEAYNICYTGIFNMPNFTVVCGNVLEIDEISKNGYYWQIVSIEFKSMGKRNKVKIYLNKKGNITAGKRYAFLCGLVTEKSSGINGWAYHYVDMFNQGGKTEMTREEMQEKIDEKGGIVTMNIVTSEKDYAVVTCTIESNARHVMEIGEVTEQSLPNDIKGYPSTAAWEMAFDKAARRFLGLKNEERESVKKTEERKYELIKQTTQSETSADSGSKLDKVITFGRFRGETIKEALENPDFKEYVTWLKQSDVSFKHDLERQELLDIIRSIDINK